MTNNAPDKNVHSFLSLSPALFSPLSSFDIIYGIFIFVRFQLKNSLATRAEFLSDSCSCLRNLATL